MQESSAQQAHHIGRSTIDPEWLESFTKHFMSLMSVVIKHSKKENNGP